METPVRPFDELIPVPSARTKQHNPKRDTPLTELQSVRFWPSCPGQVTLQIRTEGVTTDHGKVSLQCYSSATFGLKEALRLRAALDRWISEWSSKQVTQAEVEIAAEVRQ